MKPVPPLPCLDCAKTFIFLDSQRGKAVPPFWTDTYIGLERPSGPSSWKLCTLTVVDLLMSEQALGGQFKGAVCSSSIAGLTRAI